MLRTVQTPPLKCASHPLRRIVTLLAVAVSCLFIGQFDAHAASSIGGRFMLESHLGQIVTDQDFRGKFMLVTFGYTYCPDVCPTNLANISYALEALDKDADRVVPLFITVDPKRDTVERLRDYVSNFDERIIALTGPQPMIDRVSALYNIVSEIYRPAGWDEGEYTVDHTGSIFLMSPNGEFLVKFAHGMPPKDMAKRMLDFMP